ncbi:hypothetical protein [Paenibacillus sp. J2TS4]|uniref:hypothetical protein n=1 Tax=Paenibacillus sp. J2TS4 TaxID=2807194 RepID=UPI001B27F13B|nr:hypothetical protein [Paenibacillus sp. J2TS4]GIP35314.1 hypothetical protein J2TS4_45240 [Paenibacillus sp. J2TS4]
MRRRYPTAVYVVLSLIAIGILYNLFRNPGSFLLPVIIFGAVFLLYKFPPSRLRRMFTSGPSYYRPKTKPKAKTQRTKKARFRVIEGNKKSSNDEDEPPRYH